MLNATKNVVSIGINQYINDINHYSGDVSIFSINMNGTLNKPEIIALPIIFKGQYVLGL